MHPSILYLASASPRRAALVSLLGVKRVIIKPADIDETLMGSPAPHDFAFDLAFQKASAARSALHEGDTAGIILGADTIVVINDAILGKPTDEADARAMLRTLSGATHTVYTGIALLHSLTGESVRFVEKTRVTFREISDAEIAAYVAGGSPMDKAGSYGIQDDHGAVFVSRIDGDYYNVVGLPLCSTYMHLRQFAPTLF